MEESDIERIERIYREAAESMRAACADLEAACQHAVEAMEQFSKVDLSPLLETIKSVRSRG